jgi:hypothetical protein
MTRLCPGCGKILDGERPERIRCVPCALAHKNVRSNRWHAETKEKNRELRKKTAIMIRRGFIE